MANTSYTIGLYEKSHLRDITSISWSAPEINVATTKVATFFCTTDEASAYSPMNNVNNIFSAKVAPNQSDLLPNYSVASVGNVFIYATGDPRNGYSDISFAAYVTPTKSAVANTPYVVKLLQGGITGSNTTVSWNSTQINLSSPMLVTFNNMSSQLNGLLGVNFNRGAGLGLDMSSMLTAEVIPFAATVTQANITTNLPASSFATSQPVQGSLTTTNDIIVKQMLVSYSSGLGYYIAVTLEPTELTKTNTNYTVNLYKNGQYRATSYVSWAPNSPSLKLVAFPCSENEFNIYWGGPDISNIFSVTTSVPTSSAVTSQTVQSSAPPSTGIITIVRTYMSPEVGTSQSYLIIMTFQPTALAKPNTTYTLNLYQNGQYRASFSTSWSASGISGAFIKLATFPCTQAEYQQYGQQFDISNIFSVVVTQ
jgi:hypothetical protein